MSIEPHRFEQLIPKLSETSGQSITTNTHERLKAYFSEVSCDFVVRSCPVEKRTRNQFKTLPTFEVDEHAVRKLLSFVFSLSLMTGLVLLLWTVDLIRQTPEIPAQTPDVSYFQIILHKKKHNPIDDLYPLNVIQRGVN